jgi:hypothetical protein
MSSTNLTVVVLLVLSCLLSFCDSDLNGSAPTYANDSAIIAQIALQLDKAMYGNAYARGTYEYEHRRPGVYAIKLFFAEVSWSVRP